LQGKETKKSAEKKDVKKEVKKERKVYDLPGQKHDVPLEVWAVPFLQLALAQSGGFPGFCWCSACVLTEISWSI
jgi:hypothetical protein